MEGSIRFDSKRRRASRRGCVARPVASSSAGRPGPEAGRGDVVDRVYKAAGTSAIFLGTPFERRFRDMHTLSQQIQSRDAHFQAVGRVLLNGDPDGTFMG